MLYILNFKVIMPTLLYIIASSDLVPSILFNTLLVLIFTPVLSCLYSDFVFWHLPQLQFKNPDVQFLVFKNMTPSPFLRVYFGEIKSKAVLLVEIIIMKTVYRMLFLNASQHFTAFFII